MTIPSFEMWQQSECYKLEITVEEHNQILEALNKMLSSGWNGNYDTFISALTIRTSTTPLLAILAGVSPKGNPDNPWDTGEGEDENGPYGM